MARSDGPPGVLDVVAEIRTAVERYPREQLVEVLTYVFKHYVVEGPAPLEPPATEPDEELDASSFASLMQSLQLRYRLPELDLFEVRGDRVTVRSGGQTIAIEAAPPSRAAPVAPAPPAPVDPRAPSLLRTSVSVPAGASAATAPVAEPPRTTGPAAPASRPAEGGSPAAVAAPPAPVETRPPAPAGRAPASGAPDGGTAGTAAPKPAEPPRTGLLEID
jgi:hypothetical protein